MKARWCSVLGAVALAAAMGPAVAQSSASPASAAASAPRRAVDQDAPRRATPAELRDSATAPGDLRPEERVTPQIVIPLRKAARRPAGAASGGIDDTAARCEAQSSPRARERCRAAGKR